MRPGRATGGGTPTRETLVYLIRHAKPVLLDDRRRFVGQSDPPLSASGIEQARLLAERLREIRFDTMYSSDLRRCLATAELIAKAADRPVRVESRLREIDVGVWEGLTFEEARERYPREYAEREHDLAGYRFPGGESFRDLRRRVLPAFLRIVDEGDRNVVIVTHKGPIRLLLCEFLGLPLDELFSLKQDYCCVDEVRVSVLPDGGRRMQVTRDMR